MPVKIARKRKEEDVPLPFEPPRTHTRPEDAVRPESDQVRERFIADVKSSRWRISEAVDEQLRDGSVEGLDLTFQILEAAMRMIDLVRKPAVTPVAGAKAENRGKSGAKPR